MRLPPEQKAKWVADLRTRPPQTRGCLKDTKGRCCIGVGYEAIIGPIPMADIGQAEILTLSAAEAIGLDDCAQSKLVQMNDLDGLNFDEIANWIEENL